MKVIICLIILTFIFYSFNVFAKNCESYRKKHLAIQIKQKQGHSAKESIRLQEKERIAWQKWQSCKKGKFNKKKKTPIKQKRTIGEYKSKVNEKIIKLQQGSAFSTNKSLVVKGKYKGVKQQAWLSYYQIPKGCKKPKSTQQFAACLHEKEQQQIAFEKEYEGGY